MKKPDFAVVASGMFALATLIFDKLVYSAAFYQSNNNFRICVTLFFYKIKKQMRLKICEEQPASSEVY